MLAALLACLMLAAPAALADERAAYVLVEVGSVLNVRTHPRLKAEVLFVMERGEALIVDDVRQDGWAEVSRAGDFGYCRIEYLSDEPPADPQPYTTTAGKLRLRQLPNGDTVRKLGKGKQVMVTGWFTDADGVQWAKVDGGYIDADYLTPETLNGGT
jgi:uncharacterized protein YgiM (DUF1202 family)